MAFDSRPVADLTEAEAVDELTRLADEIAAHDIRYHQQDDPTISDAEYDALKHRNAELETRFPHLIRENSPSLRVGSARSEQFAPVEHGVPMLSLDNAFSDEDALEFDARVRRFLRLEEEVSYTAEPKIDGLSCSIRYERGALVQAATRGAAQALRPSSSITDREAAGPSPRRRFSRPPTTDRLCCSRRIPWSRKCPTPSSHATTRSRTWCPWSTSLPAGWCWSRGCRVG